MTSPMTTSLDRAAGAVVFRTTKKGREYLLLLHHDMHNSRADQKAGEYWNFPKGHIEKGETAEIALRREIAEETGLVRLRLIPGFGTRTRYLIKRNGKITPKIVFFALAQVAPKRITLSREHRAYRWLPYEAAHQALTYQNTKRILTAAEKFLKKYDRK